MSKSFNLGRKGVLRLSARTLMSFFGLISSIFVQRYLGYEAIGMIAFGASFISLFGIFGDLGFGSAHNKRVNEGKLDEGICNGTIISIKAFLSIILVFLVFLIIQIWKYFLEDIFDNETLEFVVYILLVKIFLDNLISIFKVIFSAKLEIAKNLIPRLFGRFIQMLCKVLFIIFISHKMTFEESIYVIITIEIFASFLILLLLIYQFRNKPINSPQINYIKSYSSLAFPLIFIGIIGSLNSNIDKVMIQFFVDSREVGIFTISQKIVLVLLMVSTQVSKLLFPMFSKLYDQKNLSSINIIANKSVKYISMTLVPLIVFLFIFAENILILLYGPESSESTLVLQILLLSIYVLSIAIPYSVQPVTTGNTTIPLYINLLTILINIFLNLLFIPEQFLSYSTFGMGASGAALTTFFAYNFRFFASKYYAFKLTGTRMYNRLVIHIFAGTITAFILYQLNSYYNNDFILVPYFIVTLIIYFSLLALFYEFRTVELNFYKKNLNIYLMKDYIKNELSSK